METASTRLEAPSFVQIALRCCLTAFAYAVQPEVSSAGIGGGIEAQAFDQMNENFFRTTFTSRSLDFLSPYYSFETEYNSSEGRCDFLAVPKAGSPKPAMLVEFKYFTNAAAEKGNVLGRATPDAETVEQALAYRKALTRRPDWNHPISMAVVEVCGNSGYNWFNL